MIVGGGKAGIPSRLTTGISNSLRRAVSAPESSTCAIAYEAVSLRRDYPTDFHHGLREEGRAGVFVLLAWDRKDELSFPGERNSDAIRAVVPAVR